MALPSKTFSLCVFLLLAVSAISAAGRNKVIYLNEDNWAQMLQDEWMVEFYAPWCPACRALEPIWAEFSTWSDDLGVKVAKVDVTTSPGLSGRFIVTALPTIYHVLHGQFRQYHGTRDKESFMSFIEQRKWETVDAIPAWKSPASFHMGITAHFFKLSQVLRAVHNRLMEDYGLPTWGSYLIFALATIILGALLGLIMVCFIDYLYPCRPSDIYLSQHGGFDKSEDLDRGDVDDLVDEDGSQSSQDERYSKSQSSSGAEDDEEEEEESKSVPPSPKGTGEARQRRARKAD